MSSGTLEDPTLLTLFLDYIAILMFILIRPPGSRPLFHFLISLKLIVQSNVVSGFHRVLLSLRILYLDLPKILSTSFCPRGAL